MKRRVAVSRDDAIESNTPGLGLLASAALVVAVAEGVLRYRYDET